MALRLPPPQRTQGDGMENESPIEYTVVLSPQEIPEEVEADCDDKNKITTQKFKNSGAIIKLTPQTVNKKKKDVLVNLKNKEPKFVPYEPYKAAVKPIVPNQKSNFLRGRKNSKNLPVIFNTKNKNPEGNVGKEIKEAKEEKEIEINWEKRAKALEGDVQTLKEENQQLENQLKFQVQVNGELKNLLVAAVGEDMETKVHVLTEDKLHLARALLNSAKSLSTHQEQTEWLAGQCEVWRSKFLASSVMVEELARWKASLCQKVNEAEEVMKKLLEERKQIREYLMKTHNNLCSLRDNFDLLNKRNNLKSSNIIDLSSELFKISQVLLIQLLGTDSQLNDSLESYNSLPGQTAAEKAAEHLLANPHRLQLIGEPDAACNAVVGAAVALSGQLYLQSHPPNIACCPQCSGEIKLV